uniref:Uncharacterized protein n=1 Tax=Schizaphis graminum TaxID=13262 RepID=A0A2S2PK27_SCHGA
MVDEAPDTMNDAIKMVILATKKGPSILSPLFSQTACTISRWRAMQSYNGSVTRSGTFLSEDLKLQLEWTYAQMIEMSFMHPSLVPLLKVLDLSFFIPRCSNCEPL